MVMEEDVIDELTDVWWAQVLFIKESCGESRGGTGLRGGCSGCGGCIVHNCTKNCWGDEFLMVDINKTWCCW